MAIYNLNREQTSIPFIIGSTFKCLVGPLAGYLANTIGFRPVIAFGCVLSSVGIGSCYFAPNIQLICFLWGILFGLGCSMATSVLPQVINLHFKKHASKANGVSLAGISMAGFFLSPIVTALLDRYGLAGTYLVLSAIVLNSLAASLLIKVPSQNYSENTKNISEICTSYDGTVTKDLKDSDNQHPRNSHAYECINNVTAITNQDLTSGSKESFSAIQNEASIPQEKLQSISTKMSPVSVGEFQNVSRNKGENCKMSNFLDESNKNVGEVCLSDDSKSKITSPRPKSASNKIKSCVHAFNIFLDPIFLFISLSRCIVIFFLLVIPTIIIDFSKDKNLSKNQSLFILMSFSGFDLIGKVGLGWITDGGYITVTKYTCICFCIMSASLAFMTWSNGFAMILIGVAGVSMCSGTLAPAFPVLVSKFMEKEKHTMAISSSMVMMVPLSFTTTPLIGYFRDDLGSYNGLFYSMSAFCIVCGALILSIPCLSRRRKVI
ncbi:hypothetical protein TNIN_151111 [Trichonephila inaurata madagascariensis]|uniref:Monocarboxylate transporter n=1 Tax=Trichonephila inaurata madagascariensis TaxID=2747483 RepID=A0A8X6YEB7_9ARAC|nr:hypothetical protein TNIN_151111 [Trichonephila inaurata madagascariensis]